MDDQSVSRGRANTWRLKDVAGSAGGSGGRENGLVARGICRPFKKRGVSPLTGVGIPAD